MKSVSAEANLATSVDNGKRTWRNADLAGRIHLRRRLPRSKMGLDAYC